MWSIRRRGTSNQASPSVSNIQLFFGWVFVVVVASPLGMCSTFDSTPKLARERERERDRLYTLAPFHHSRDKSRFTPQDALTLIRIKMRSGFRIWLNRFGLAAVLTTARPAAYVFNRDLPSPFFVVVVVAVVACVPLPTLVEGVRDERATGSRSLYLQRTLAPFAA